MKQEPIEVTGVMLRGIYGESDGQRDLIVSVEVDGKWVDIIEESFVGPISHIVEPSGIRGAADKSKPN